MEVKHLQEDMDKIKSEMMTKMNKILEMLEKEHEIEVPESKEENSDKKCPEENSDANIEKDEVKTKEVTKEVDKMKEKEQNWFKCESCDYKVKKKITLNKHMNTKHCRTERDEKQKEERKEERKYFGEV